MKLISFLTKYSPLLLVLSIIAGVISGIASSAMVALVNESIEHINTPGSLVAWAFAGVMLTALVTELTSRLLLLRLSTQAVREMRLNLCEQILRSPLRQIEDHGSGRLMAALTEDIHHVTAALTEFPKQCVNAAVAVACFAYLFWLHWPLAFAFLGIFSIGTFVYNRIARRTRPYLEQGRLKWDELIQHYNGLIDGNKELKLHRRRRHSFEDEELKPTAQSMMTLSWTWNKIFAIASTYGQFIYFVLIGVVLFVAPQFGVFETSVLTGFVLMALFMSSPISSMVGSLPTFHQADVSLNRIRELGLSLSAAEDIDVKDYQPGEPEKPPRFESIQLRNLEYEYFSDDDDEPGFGLGPIDLEIRPGELLFVIGGNGSGKSSFVRVLTGLYPQKSGELLFNGELVTDDNRDDYRQNFSVVFSDYYLFKSLYGLFSDEFAEKADTYLQRLELTEKVTLEGSELSTVELSQGQRKRLALLTSFLEDRHIYIFDEWAADQDPTFKRVFYHEILPELIARGKTVIVVSHDNHYFDAADRVVQFENGRIVEDRYLEAHERATPSMPPRREPLEAAQDA
ncbi:MAG: cyclic peptide export ABC transporter [Wenzhouxiangellaceae bacterium]